MERGRRIWPAGRLCIQGARAEEKEEREEAEHLTLEESKSRKERRVTLVGFVATQEEANREDHGGARQRTPALTNNREREEEKEMADEVAGKCAARRWRVGLSLSPALIALDLLMALLAGGAVGHEGRGEESAYPATHRGEERFEATEDRAVEDEDRTVTPDEEAWRSSAVPWRTRPRAAVQGETTDDAGM